MIVKLMSFKWSVIKHHIHLAHFYWVRNIDHLRMNVHNSKTTDGYL